MAKVVASRGGRPSLRPSAPPSGSAASSTGSTTATATKFHALDNEPQTDKLFDREVVERMGREFYREVFAPAIKRAFDEGRSYESIRDAIRREWKP